MKSGRLQNPRREGRPGRGGGWHRDPVWLAHLALAALVCAGSLVAWRRLARAPEEKPSLQEASAPGRPVLRLECPGLAIGSGEGSMQLILDEGGVVRDPGARGVAGLPELGFEPLSGLIIGQPGPDPFFAVAAELTLLWARDWGERLGPLAGMERTGVSGLTLKTVEGTEILFLTEDLARQFRNLEAIWRQTHKEGRELATVNLMPERNVPVTFR